MNSIDVIAKHPKRRPHTLTLRNLDASFEFSVCGLKCFFRSDASGRVFARGVVGASESFLNNLDYEVAVFLI